jgi:hypothetical protein
MASRLAGCCARQRAGGPLAPFQVTTRIPGELRRPRPGPTSEFPLAATELSGTMHRSRRLCPVVLLAVTVTRR